MRKFGRCLILCCLGERLLVSCSNYVKTHIVWQTTHWMFPRWQLRVSGTWKHCSTYSFTDLSILWRYGTFRSYLPIKIPGSSSRFEYAGEPYGTFPIFHFSYPSRCHPVVGVTNPNLSGCSLTMRLTRDLWRLPWCWNWESPHNPSPFPWTSECWMGDLLAESPTLHFSLT